MTRTTTMRGFLGSREGAGWLVIAAFAAALAVVAGGGFYSASLQSFVANKTDEKATALGLVDAFSRSAIRRWWPSDTKSPAPLITRKMNAPMLSNAIKFTPPGGSVALSVRHESERGVAITVADTGIGIAEQELHRVLQPFEQADSSLARKHEGTGLGLPLVKAMIELHGGSLTLKSAVDKGTEVTIVFPSERIIPTVTALPSAA